MDDDPVRRFLEDELASGASTLSDDDDLLVPGLLDSLGVVRLVAAIEDAEGLTIEQDEINPDNFRSVRTIRALLARKREARG